MVSENATSTKMKLIHLIICLLATACMSFVLVELFNTLILSIFFLIFEQIMPLLVTLLHYPLLLWNMISHWVFFTIYLTMLTISMFIFGISNILKHINDKLPNKLYEIVKISLILLCFLISCLVAFFTIAIFETLAINVIYAMVVQIVGFFFYAVSSPVTFVYLIMYSISFFYCLRFIDFSLRCVSLYRDYMAMESTSFEDSFSFRRAFMISKE